MKKLVSCILTATVAMSLNIPTFAGAKEFLQTDINHANAVLNRSNKANELVKEISKLSRSMVIFQNEQEGYVLQSIDIVSGLKDTYIQGEKINATKLEAYANYIKSTKARAVEGADTKREPITITEDDIKGFDSSNPSAQTLTISVNEVTTEKEIEVVQKKLTSIKITKQPTKLTYLQGEALDLTGLEVIGTYNDGSSKVETVTLNDISGFDPDIIGNQTLILKIGEKSAYLQVTVIADELKSIAISKQPAKLIYQKGEALDITGLEVTGTYESGSSKVETVTSSDISGFDSSKLGKQTLTVKIKEKTATFEIEIKGTELPPESNDIKIDRLQYTPPVAFEAELKVTLTKATTNELKLSDFSIHCPGLKDMTIASVSNATGADKNKVYTLKLASYSDNNYVLEVYLNQGTANEITLEKEFAVRDTNCPIISYPYVTRTDATNAKFKFSSDAPGKIYYLAVKNDLSRARASTPTAEDIQRANKSLDITVAPAEIAISDLVENTAYSLYYITTVGTDMTDVYGPIEISAEPEPSATSKITITEAKVLEDARTQSVKITLSEPTATPLEIKNFEIKCPAGSNLKFDEFTNIGNQTYTLIMHGGFRDNNYEAKVTFPDGTFTTGTFRCDLATPNITGMSPIRTSETSATITFNSNLEGNIYYGVSKEASKKPSVAEILATGKKQAIHPNKNTIILNDITMSDKHFYWLAESKSGSKPYFVDGAGNSDFTGRIPDEITGDKPTVPLEVEIEKVEKEGSSLKVTLTKDYADGIINIDQFAPIEIGNDNVNWNSTYNFSINSLSSGNPDRKRVFTLSPRGDTRFVAGTYKISITFKDGVNTKEFTIQ